MVGFAGEWAPACTKRRSDETNAQVDQDDGTEVDGINAHRYPAHCAERSLCRHVYDEKTAEDVAAQICNDFLPLLKALGKFYRD